MLNRFEVILYDNHSEVKIKLKPKGQGCRWLQSAHPTCNCLLVTFHHVICIVREYCCSCTALTSQHVCKSELTLSLSGEEKLGKCLAQWLKIKQIGFNPLPCNQGYNFLPASPRCEELESHSKQSTLLNHSR